MICDMLYIASHQIKHRKVMVREALRRAPLPQRLRVSCAGGYGIRPYGAKGQRGSNCEVPRASNARPYVLYIIKNTACPSGQAVSFYQVI